MQHSCFFPQKILMKFKCHDNKCTVIMKMTTTRTKNNNK